VKVTVILSVCARDVTIKVEGEKYLTFLTRVIDIITFKLPYYGLYEMTKVCGRRHREIMKKLPFRTLEIPKILPDGNIIIVPWEDHGVDWAVYHNAVYNRFFTPQPGNVVVDAGAHIGVYTLKAAKEVGNRGQVIAIEPEDKNYKLLIKNIRINRHQNVTPVKMSLSNFEGKARLFLKARSRSHSLIGKTWVTPIVDVTETDVTTLDKLLDRLDIKKVDILKINVEGAELNLLEGSRELLANGRISKIVATPHPPCNQEANKISGYLKTFSYKIKVVDDAQILYAECERSMNDSVSR